MGSEHLSLVRNAVARHRALVEADVGDAEYVATVQDDYRAHHRGEPPPDYDDVVPLTQTLVGLRRWRETKGGA